MSWRKVINAACFPGAMRGRIDLHLALSLSRACGFHGIELLHCEAGDPSRFSSQLTLAAWKRLSADAGLPITSMTTLVHRRFPFTTEDRVARATARDQLVSMLRCAAELGCESVSVTAGDRKGLSRSATATATAGLEQAFPLAVGFFQDVAPVVEHLGISLCLENIWTDLVTAPDDLVAVIDGVGSSAFGACLDLGNAERYAPAEEWVRRLGPRLRKVHVTDFNPLPAPRIVAVGTGQLHVARVRKALYDIGYAGPLVTEQYFRNNLPLETQIERLSNEFDECLSCTVHKTAGQF